MDIISEFDLVSPVVEINAGEEFVRTVADRRKGHRIGFLSNRKPNATVIEEAFAELMREHGFEVVDLYEKKGPGEPAGDELLDQIAEQCDVVVTGIGDCGSCTSWSVHDAVELEVRGLATAMICTEAFAPLASAQATSLGRPDIHLVKVTHPIGGIPPQAAADKARTVWSGMDQWLGDVVAVPAV